MYIPLFFLDFINCAAISCRNFRQIKFIYYHKAFFEIRQYLTGADNKKIEKNKPPEEERTWGEEKEK